MMIWWEKIVSRRMDFGYRTHEAFSCLKTRRLLSPFSFSEKGCRSPHFFEEGSRSLLHRTWSYPFSSLKILDDIPPEAMQSSTAEKEKSKPKDLQAPAAENKSSRKRHREETGETTPVNPAHAPIITNDGMVEFSLTDIHKHLICGLCSGYYKDPYTITDCLHTFCKSCLLYAVACGCHECPECHVYLGGDPLKVAVLDHCMQDVRTVITFLS